MWCGIVLAGGSGSRMGAGRNKVLLSLRGEAVLHRSVRLLRPHAEALVVVCRPEDAEAIRLSLEDFPGLIFAEGGETRQASVRNGLAAVPEGCDYVLVHDGARCMVDGDTIRRCKESAESTGSGVAAVPAVDTIKVADPSGLVLSTPDRKALWTVQTPQCFRRELLEAAFQRAERDGFLGTDDASLLEHAGLPVHLALGSRKNIKLTVPEDIAMAEAMLSPLPSLRIGMGYDVHRLVEGRKLILCGVEIPHTLGLLGHSDADVALHALMDAMLGACALGDIGRHFPDTDERYRGISSMKLLEHTVTLLRQQGARVTNADVTIAAQKPKLLPYVPEMRQRVADALSLPVDRISIKATTTEHLGFEGRQEGISAQAVCMVEVNEAGG